MFQTLRMRKVQQINMIRFFYIAKAVPNPQHDRSERQRQGKKKTKLQQARVFKSISREE